MYKLKANSEVTTYRNKRNPHKYIDVKRSNDSHYSWRQRMKFDNGVENPIGTPKGGYSRQTKDAIHDVIDDDYEIVESSKYTQKHLNQNIKSATQKDKYVNISHGKQRFGVHMFNEDPRHLSFQITEIHPYDDAEYTWAKVEPSGNILYVRDGKITDRSHVWLYDDYDYERPEDYIDDVLDDIATDLIEMNKDVKPVMVHW